MRNHGSLVDLSLARLSVPSPLPEPHQLPLLQNQSGLMISPAEKAKAKAVENVKNVKKEKARVRARVMAEAPAQAPERPSEVVLLHIDRQDHGIPSGLTAVALS